jgi:hypothetical protein
MILQEDEEPHRLNRLHDPASREVLGSRIEPGYTLSLSLLVSRKDDDYGQ